MVDTDSRRNDLRLIAALFAMLTFSSGLGFYNQSVLLEALTRERELAVSVVSSAMTLFFLVSGVAGLGVAWLIERFDPRVPVTLGVCVSAMALVLMGRVDTFVELVLVFALFGVGFSASGMVTGTTIVARSFVRRRALVMATVSTGLSLGGVVLTPFSAAAIARLGLERAMPWVALALVLGVLPIAWAWLRPRQPDAVQPDAVQAISGARGSKATPALAAEAPVETPAETLAATGLTFSEALRTRYFYCVTFAFVGALSAQVGGIAHHFNLASGVVAPEVARASVAILASASIVGRFVAGGLTRFVPLRTLTVVLMLTQGLAIVSLGRASDTTQLLALTVFFGLTVGSTLLMQPLLVAEAFGTRAYARIYAMVGLAVSFGLAAGPALLGFAHARMGGYPRAFAVVGSISFLAAGALLIAGSTRLTSTARVA